MFWKLTFALCFLGCLLPAAETPKPTADVLGRWVGGKWIGDGKLVDTDYSKAMAVSGVTNCAWSPDHIFVVCDQNNTIAGRRSAIFRFTPSIRRRRTIGCSVCHPGRAAARHRAHHQSGPQPLGIPGKDGDQRQASGVSHGQRLSRQRSRGLVVGILHRRWRALGQDGRRQRVAPEVAPSRTGSRAPGRRRRSRTWATSQPLCGASLSGGDEGVTMEPTPDFYRWGRLFMYAAFPIACSLSARRSWSDCLWLLLFRPTSRTAAAGR